MFTLSNNACQAVKCNEMHNPLTRPGLRPVFNGVKQRSTMKTRARSVEKAERFDDQLAFRCYKALRQQVVAIRKREHRRDDSEVLRLLVERGIAAYDKDGKLVEGVGPQTSGPRADKDA